MIALVIFGPNELPTIAAQVGHALRDLRQIAEEAKNDLREGLGPEFAAFEIEDLNPKRFMQKHLSGGPAHHHAAAGAAGWLREVANVRYASVAPLPSQALAASAQPGPPVGQSAADSPAGASAPADDLREKGKPPHEYRQEARPGPYWESAAGGIAWPGSASRTQPERNCRPCTCRWTPPFAIVLVVNLIIR